MTSINDYISPSILVRRSSSSEITGSYLYGNPPHNYKSSPCKFRSSVIDRDFTNLNLIEAWVQYALPGYNLCHGTSAAEAKRMNL
jgi:hypothetical protein